MMDRQETTADIIAEMRKSDRDEICPWWADGGSCDLCPLGRNGKNCSFSNYADRLEAAHKRERGNAAKLREMAEFVAHIDDNGYTSHDVQCAIDKARAALKTPSRNCDMPKVMEDHWRAWLDDKSNWDEFGSPKLEIHDWLLAPATEKEGGAK